MPVRSPTFLCRHGSSARWPSARHPCDLCGLLPVNDPTVGAREQHLVGKTGTAAQRTLPDDQRTPSLTDDSCERVAITLAIAVDLGCPEFRPGRRQTEQGAIMSVPEAAMDEDHGAMNGKHEIRLSGQPLVVEPVAQAKRMQTAPDDHLRPGIGSADARHAQPALRGRERIGTGCPGIPARHASSPSSPGSRMVAGSDQTNRTSSTRKLCGTTPGGSAAMAASSCCAQRRALVVWQRLILPDGASIRLDNMPATDLTGYAGLADRVDFHTWTLLKGVAIATLLGVGSELSISGESDLVQAIRESAQSNTARAGDQITQRNLDIQPTITIRPGAPVRVLVTRDLILAPWRGTAGA